MPDPFIGRELYLIHGNDIFFIIITYRQQRSIFPFHGLCRFQHVSCLEINHSIVLHSNKINFFIPKRTCIYNIA